MSELTDLPNISDKVAEELHRVDINNSEQLITLGSVEAFCQITRNRPITGYNLLYALEGAIRGLRWHSLEREHLDRLRKEYDERMSNQ
jgi:DNA transformation protein